MYLIEGIRFGKCKVRRMNWALASPLLACESIRFFGATTRNKSAVRRLHLSLRRKNCGTKFTGCQKIELQSSLNLRKRLASDHLFRISTSVFPSPETTVKLSFVSKCSHLRFRSWRFDNILSSLPTSIFQCHHSWSSSSNLCHHYSITKLFTLANLQNN